jgi:hypothetical protein
LFITTVRMFVTASQMPLVCALSTLGHSMNRMA